MFRIVDQLGDFRNNCVEIGSDKFNRSGIEGFRSFRRIPHDKDRLAESGCFFLDPARIGKAEEAPCFEVVAIKDFNRFNDVNTVAGA